MSLLVDTNLEIRAEMLAEQRRRARQARAERPMRLLDALIDDLEEQHLRGRKRVPETFDDRLADLLAVCPAARSHQLRSRMTIVHLLDRLFEIQEQLLEAKSGAVWGPRDDAGHPLPEAAWIG